MEEGKGVFISKKCKNLSWNENWKDKKSQIEIEMIEIIDWKKKKGRGLVDMAHPDVTKSVNATNSY